MIFIITTWNIMILYNIFMKFLTANTFLFFQKKIWHITEHFPHLHQSCLASRSAVFGSSTVSLVSRSCCSLSLCTALLGSKENPITAFLDSIDQNYLDLYETFIKANLQCRGGRHFNNRYNRNREAENSAAAKSRMDFYFSPRHFPLVEIRL